MRFSKYAAAALLLGTWMSVPGSRAQDGRGQGTTPPDSMQAPGLRGEGRQRPLVGKITAIRAGVMDVAKPNGDSVTVRLSNKTEYRKDREPAKLGDFKVGDFVMVRGEENEDHSVSAQMVATRSGGPGGGPGGAMGTLGKDFVVGEIKAIDAPKLTVLRVDNVTQTLELNEGTSLRKGRESITMEDIQAGDHVMARGELQNGVFVPKLVMVISTEQWQRMQEMGLIRFGGEAGAKPTAPDGNAKTKPQEQPN